MMAPNTRALRRIPDKRAIQFWDRDRLLSHAMGEDAKRTPVWDWAGLYAKNASWNGAPPKPLFSGRTVIEVADKLDHALAQ